MHEGLQAAKRVAAGQRPHRRPDLPGPVHSRAAVRTCAARSTRPDGRLRLARRAPTGRRLRPARPGSSTARSTRTATRCASSTRATCRCWAATRGSGCWWVRWWRRPVNRVVAQRRALRRGDGGRGAARRRRGAGPRRLRPDLAAVKGVTELDEASATEQERYGDVLAVGPHGGRGVHQHPTTTTAQEHRRGDGRRDRRLREAVRPGDRRRLIKLLQDNKSMMDGEVIWAGVVAQDPDSATVIVATTGTVAEQRRPATSPWPATSASSSSSSPTRASG